MLSFFLVLSFSLILHSASYVFIKVSRTAIALYEIFEIDIGKCNLSLNWIIIFRSFAQTNQISTRSQVLIKVSFYFSAVRLARANLIAICNRIYLATIAEKRRGLRARGGPSTLLSSPRHVALHKTHETITINPDSRALLHRWPIRSRFLDRPIHPRLPSWPKLHEQCILQPFEARATLANTRDEACTRRAIVPSASSMRPPVRRSAVNCREPRAATARHREW